MKKNIIKRGLFGIPVGIMIGHLITIVISLLVNDGNFYPVTPELISSTGSELNAVIVQTVLCAIMGAGFAAASVIWDIDSWSIVKQSAIYFVIACLLMFPIAYAANWMRHDIAGIISYAAIFFGLYIATWLIQYLIWKINVRKLNDGLKK